MKAIALVPTNLSRTPLGLPSFLLHDVAGRTVLSHTIARLARCESIAQIVLVHPAGQDPLSIVGPRVGSMAISAFAYDPAKDNDVYHEMRLAGRKWSLNSWRGGLGSATCYDEPLSPARLSQAAKAHEADAALIVGADWMLVDPALCDAVMKRHLEAPEAMKMVFTQAPPGLAGIAVNTALLESLAQSRAGFGQVLGYQPSRPQADPIGLDVCVQIPAAVRSSGQRYIYDMPRSIAMIKAIAEELKGGLVGATCERCAAIGDRAAAAQERDALPREVTIELTPRRPSHGPLTPQHYISFDRPDLDPALARRLIEQLGDAGDVVVTFGGVGDALLHPQWEELVRCARGAGVLGIHVETDLLVDEDALGKLLSLPIDVVSVRLNADTAAMYERTMNAPGCSTCGDHFSRVVQNLQWLLYERQQRAAAHDGTGPSRAALPWIVPRMAKTSETLEDMETFFDRWMHYAGHAVIESVKAGRGFHRDLTPAMNIVDMSPPRRVPCRQLHRRMTILSDGCVALCDQDWLGDGSAGDATITPLLEIWQTMQETRDAHDGGKWSQLSLCGGCREWHRP